jgi:CRISPR-associated protein Cmr5
MIQTMGQKRAAFTLKKLEKINLEFANSDPNIESDQKNEWKRFTAGIPAMMLQNGFGQTLAFFVAKRDKNKQTDKYKRAFDLIKDWLQENNNFAEDRVEEHDFLKAIVEVDQTQYFELRKETMALMEWVKRFAAMFAPAEKDEGNDE